MADDANEVLAAEYGSPSPGIVDQLRAYFRRRGDDLVKQGEKPFSSQLNDVGRNALPAYAHGQDSYRAYQEGRSTDAGIHGALAAAELGLPFLMGKLATRAGNRGWEGDSPSARDAFPAGLSTTAAAPYISGPAAFGIRPAQKTVSDMLPGAPKRAQSTKEETDAEFWGWVKSQSDLYKNSASPEARMYAQKAMDGVPKKYTTDDQAVRSSRQSVNEVAAARGEPPPFRTTDPSVPHEEALSDAGRALLAGKGQPPSEPSGRTVGNDAQTKVNPRQLEKDGALTLLNEPRGVSDMPSEGLPPEYLRALRQFWSMGKPERLHASGGVAKRAAGGPVLDPLIAAILQRYYGDDNG